MSLESSLDYNWCLKEDVFLTELDSNRIKIMKISELETQIFHVEGLVAQVIKNLGPPVALKNLISTQQESILKKTENKLKFMELLEELSSLGILTSKELE